MTESLRAPDHSASDFRRVYDRYAGPLFRFAQRFASSAEAAEEIVHEAFVQYLSGRFHGGEAELKAWLFAIVRNRAIDAARRARRERAEEPETLDARTGTALPESDYERVDLEKKAEQAASGLAPELAEAWRLRRQGLRNEEMAAILGVPIGTVKSRVFRLIERLRQELKIES